MSSPNLKKINPKFEVDVKLVDEKDYKPNLKAEFVDGSVWETPSNNF